MMRKSKKRLTSNGQKRFKYKDIKKDMELDRLGMGREC